MQNLTGTSNTDLSLTGSHNSHPIVRGIEATNLTLELPLRSGVLRLVSEGLDLAAVLPHQDPAARRAQTRVFGLSLEKSKTPLFRSGVVLCWASYVLLCMGGDVSSARQVGDR